MPGDIVLSAIFEPGHAHAFSFDVYGIGKSLYDKKRNITEILIELRNEEGQLEEKVIPDIERDVWEIDNKINERLLGLIYIKYVKVPPFNVFGYVSSNNLDSCATYALSGAAGDPERKTWLNQMVVPLPADTDEHQTNMFVGNPSRWADLRYRLRLHLGRTSVVCEGEIPPKGHHLLHPKSMADRLGLSGQPDAISLVSRNKTIPYLVGSHKPTGAVTFIEHLVSRPRAGDPIAPPRAVGLRPADSGDLLDSVLCYCTGATLAETLADDRVPNVGQYCTGCRADLAAARAVVSRDSASLNDGERLKSQLEERFVF